MCIKLTSGNKFIGILSLFLLFITFNSNAQLAGWSYSIPVTIQNTSGVQKLNFQVLVTLNTKGFIDAGEMKNTGADIRFAKKCDGTNQLDYFIESGINTSETNIWVKLDTLPATGSKTLYLFYGNAGASAVSNFATTFPNSLIVTASESLTPDITNWDYDWIEIKSGATVDLGAGHMGTFKMNARRIIVDGVINLTGKGYLGGVSGAGMGPGGGQPNPSTTSVILGGGGGAGHGGKGGKGGYCCNQPNYAGNGGIKYGELPTDTVDRGSGGGAVSGGGNNGGNGGGAIFLTGSLVSIGGSISCNGLMGTVNEPIFSTGSGGGAGGGVLMNTKQLIISGNIYVIGGDGLEGGAGGGAGAGGHIKLHYSKLKANSTNFNVLGGVGGASTSTAAGNAPHIPGGDGENGILLLDSNYNSKEPIISFNSSSPTAPGISITADENTICPGNTVNFSSTIVNGGATPVYQWKQNGNAISGAITSSYSSATLNPTDAISCQLTVASGCPSVALSNDIIILDGAPLATFTVSPDQVCTNYPTTITYTGDADNTATYSWNFDSGIVEAGSGQGPYQVKWTSGGSKTISLQVSVAECTSNIYTTTVTVDQGPDANFSGLLPRYCIGASDVFLTPETAGGTFSGPGITGTTFSPNTAGEGTHSIKYVVSNATCTDSVVKTVLVTSTPPNANFAYTKTNICQNDTDKILPNYVSEEGQEGTFTIAPSTGLVINPSTREINPKTSVPGNYTITNTIPASGGCSESTASVNIIILATPNSSFTGLNTTYCTTSGNDTLIPTTPGGTFSSEPTGLSVDQNTGVIMPYASNAGDYMVIYTVSGACTNRDTILTKVNTGPEQPTVADPSLTYCQNQTADQLSASGENLLWYTDGLVGGTGSSTAPTPSTSTVGSYYYYVTQTNAIGCESFRSIISVEVSICNGISINDELGKHISVYPNPASDKINIIVEKDNIFQEATLQNMLGQSLLVSKKMEINLSGIEQGIYLLKVKTEKGIAGKRIEVLK